MGMMRKVNQLHGWVDRSMDGNIDPGLRGDDGDDGDDGDSDAGIV